MRLLLRKDGSESNTYLLVVEVPEFDLRVSKDQNHPNIIYWVDPPGGPRIALGEKVKGLELGKVKYIDRIKNYGYVITFENDLSSHQTTEDSESTD